MPEQPWSLNPFYVKEDLSEVDSVALIWYDQLNSDVWSKDIRDCKKPLLFIESTGWFNELPYHKQKIAFHLSTLRHSVMECYGKKHKVYYILTIEKLDNELKNLLDSSTHFKVT